MLSLGVFLLWGYFLSETQGPPPEQTQVQGTKNQVAQSKNGGKTNLTPALPETKPSESIDQSEGDNLPLNSSEEIHKEQLIEVKNKMGIYVFSTKGGILKKVLVTKYKDDEGNPLNLIKESPENKYPLTLETGNPAVDKVLQQGHFEPSVSSLELSPTNTSGDLQFKLKHSSGLTVLRKLKFEYDNRLIGVETEIKAPNLINENLQFSVLWGPGLAGGSGNSQAEFIAFTGPTTFINNEREENPPSDITGEIIHKGDLEWTSLQNKYFAAALIPESGIKSAIVKKDENENIYVGLNLESVQSAASAKHHLYVGTKELEILESLGHKLFRLIDYGWLGNKFAFLVKPMLKALNFFYGITHNYGWAIIFLTFLIKLVLFPLTHKSFKSMKGMQKIQPYVKVIQERNKNDRSKLNQELMDLYKKHKVNPLGGCLPMLLQIPVFISLYHALFFSIELRGAPFMLWIQDLSQSDPYYVTPVLMGATMYLQQKMTPTVADPVQQKIFLIMPVVFTFLFITFPAGLVIYWTVNNILTIAQQFYIYRIAKD